MSARRRGLAKAAILVALGVAVFTVPVATATAGGSDAPMPYAVTDAALRVGAVRSLVSCHRTQ